MPDVDTLPTAAEAADDSMHGREAAALLLLLFGEQEAADVLTRLEPNEVQTLGEAMFAITNVSEREVNQVFDRFVQKASTRTTIGYRADQQIQGMMQRALGPDRAANMLDRIVPQKSSSSLDQLKWMTAEEIAEMIIDEHPQIVALVLTHLTPEMAASVLGQLPAVDQDDVIFRVATMGEVTTTALAEIEQLMTQTKSGARNFVQQTGGTTGAAAIMNNIGKNDEQRIIKALAKRNKKIAQVIEEAMFVFADLIDLDDKNLGTLLRSVDNENLILSLKGADGKLAERMFGCMSSRAAQSIQDEMEERGPLSRDDVIAAQKQIVAQARALADEGAIMLGGQGDDFV